MSVNRDSEDKVISSGIGYSGSLTMRTYVGEKEVRTQNFSNSGSDLLFRLIAQTIAGINTSNSMPKYLDIGKWDSDNNVWQSGLVNRLTLQSPIVMDNGKVKFTTSFGHYDVLPGSGYDRMRLYNQYIGGDHLAQIVLQTGQEIDSDNMNLRVRVVVEWIMSISNK